MFNIVRTYNENYICTHAFPRANVKSNFGASGPISLPPSHYEENTQQLALPPPCDFLLGLLGREPKLLPPSRGTIFVDAGTRFSLSAGQREAAAWHRANGGLLSSKERSLYAQ